MKNFDGLGLHTVLAKSLTHMKYDTPTPIQAKAIPIALEGRDVLGSAQTGTGKTAAFAIPLVEALLNSDRKTALVMTPTRELGKQVMDIMRQLLGPKPSIKTAFLIGGESLNKQYSQLQRRPRLVVGTPGRINDHIERGNLHLDQCEFLVLDETDRMLDMGFGIQIDRIVKHIPDERQTLMFSATMPKNIMSMADKYLTNPERVSVGSTFNPAENIDQKTIRVEQSAKYEVLDAELHGRNGSVIVFVKTKRNADRLARKLKGDGHEADAIHGDLKQRQRDRVIKNFRSENFRILVATDVVARGLDVPHVAHVINYDLPQMPEDYIHRIGRTARAGAKGEALCLIASHDVRQWFEIEKLMFPDKHPAKPERSGGGKKGKFGGRKKSYANENEQRPRGKKPYKGKQGDKPRRKFSDAPKGEEGQERRKKRYDDRQEAAPRGERNQERRGKKPYEGGKRNEENQERRSRKSYDDAPRGEGNQERRKKKFAGGQDEKSQGNKARRKPYKNNEDTGSDKPRSRKPYKAGAENGSDKPRGKKPYNKKKKFAGPKPDAKPKRRRDTA